MSMRPMVLAVSAVTLLCIGSGCGGSKEPATTTGKTPAAAEGPVWKPAGDEGRVTGRVNFQGPAPKVGPISMDADPACAAKHTGPVYPETVTVNGNGTLRNVFVFVKSGLEGKNFAMPDQPAVLDQDGCVYRPHVLGMRAGQNLKLVTSDKTSHNIHPLPRINKEWNVSQPPGGDAIIQTFARPEETIPVKCNQHAWMRAYIHVLDHPYFAVTGEDGSFTLANLPPGDYEIEALHEEYGATTQKVTVPAKGSATADFTYNPGHARGHGSLRTVPALVLPGCVGM